MTEVILQYFSILKTNFSPYLQLYCSAIFIGYTILSHYYSPYFTLDYTHIYVHLCNNFLTEEKMVSVKPKSKKERLSFFVDSELSNKVNQISQHTKITVSEIARKALLHYINKIEKEKIEQELEAGYKANYDYYLKSQEDWKYADKE